MAPPSGSSAICFCHEIRSFRSFSSPAVAGSSGRSGRVAPSRCISTADGNGSTSEKNAGVHPKCRQARLAASTPLQILPYFILRMILWMGGECLHPVHTQKIRKRSAFFHFFCKKKRGAVLFTAPRGGNVRFDYVTAGVSPRPKPQPLEPCLSAISAQPRPVSRHRRGFSGREFPREPRES